MQFLRTMFWVVLAVLGVIFSFNNGQRVDVVIWSDIVFNMPLWFVVLLSFLIGLLPVLILHRTTRWSLKRKLEAANRSLSDSLTTPSAPEPVRQQPYHDVTAINPPGAL
jgi:lipopolysaccharide assembly protein A